MHFIFVHFKTLTVDNSGTAHRRDSPIAPFEAQGPYLAKFVLAYKGQDLGGQISIWIEAGGFRNNEKNRKIKKKYRENISITLEIFMLVKILIEFQNRYLNTYLMVFNLSRYLLKSRRYQPTNLQTRFRKNRKKRKKYAVFIFKNKLRISITLEILYLVV